MNVCLQCGDPLSETSIGEATRQLAASTFAAPDSPVRTKPSLVTSMGRPLTPRSPSLGVSQDSSFVFLPPTGRQDSRANSVMGAKAAVLAKILSMTQELADPEVGSGRLLRLTHPVCEECAGLLYLEIDEAFAAGTAECEAIDQVLAELEQAAGKRPGSLEESVEELDALEKEEAALLASLSLVQEERSSLARKIEIQKSEEANLKALEHRFWNEFNDLECAREALSGERDALHHQIRNFEEQLDRLKKTNVYNDVFHIWPLGHIGTINGFRLGSATGTVEDWSELNAAYGNTALLLYSMAYRCRMSFRGYAIVPMGSTTKICLTDGDNQTKAQYDLFYNSKNAKSFNNAQVAFLACVRQFVTFAQNEDKEIRVPYSIDEAKGTIEGLSILYSSSRVIEWTKALKHLLSNLKFLLIFVAKLKT